MASKDTNGTVTFKSGSQSGLLSRLLNDIDEGMKPQESNEVDSETAKRQRIVEALEQASPETLDQLLAIVEDSVDPDAEIVFDIDLCEDCQEAYKRRLAVSAVMRGHAAVDAAKPFDMEASKRRFLDAMRKRPSP